MNEFGLNRAPPRNCNCTISEINNKTNVNIIPKEILWNAFIFFCVPNTYLLKVP